MAPSFNKRHWRYIIRKAAFGHYTPKYLRDTYASHLFMLGVPVLKRMPAS